MVLFILSTLLQCVQHVDIFFARTDPILAGDQGNLEQSIFCHPAQVGIQKESITWIPAFAGMPKLIEMPLTKRAFRRMLPGAKWKGRASVQFVLTG
jgi:hypothetical protein